MIDEPERNKLAESIDRLLSLQRRFQEEHGFDFWKANPEKRREMLVRTLFAAISELSEAGDEVNKWWKKEAKGPESLDEKRQKILEEMIDSLHFFLAALLIMNAGGKEVTDCYLDKLGVNFRRQKDSRLGYV